MSLFIDRKYAGLISTRLTNFKQKSTNVYNFRCPICLDSKKSKSKSRGYFYAKGNDLFFTCHNCSAGTTLANFIKELDPTLYKQYIMERWQNGENGFSNYQKPQEKDLYNFDKNWKEYFIGNQSIKSLDDKHFAKVYILNRQIPEKYQKDLYFIPDFKKFVDKILPDNEYNLTPNDPRVVIPIINRKNKLIGFQGRSLIDPIARYITIKISNDPKIFGLNYADITKTIYVTEGPFDSMFVENGIAMVGSDCSIEDLPKNCVFVYDNEPKNFEIVGKMEKIINENFPIVIWPSMLKEKDINDMVINGIDVNVIIKQNSFTGMEAMTKLACWRKI